MSMSMLEREAYNGWKSKAQRLETERNNLRTLLNETNADARQMTAQLDGIEDTLRFVTERAERLASADPTDLVRAGRAAALREFLGSVESITGRTA